MDGKVYRFLGLTVGLVIHDVQPQDRRKAYLADVTYGTNNEFGFDYLRDNMVVYKPAWCSAAMLTPSWTRWTPS